MRSGTELSQCLRLLLFGIVIFDYGFMTSFTHTLSGFQLNILISKNRYILIYLSSIVMKFTIKFMFY